MHHRGRKSKRYALEPIEPRLLLSKTVYVDANAAGAVHDGTSWNTAFVDLQQGLAAAVSGDEIHVADGTYKPTSTTDRSKSFPLRSGVSLLGGYAGMGAPDPEARDTSAYPTILSGNIGSQNSKSDNSYHVVSDIAVGTTPSALDGLVITAGNATVSNTSGGGLYLIYTTTTISNCTFTGNSANFGGGAIYNSADLTLSGCTFSLNSSLFGGAIYSVSTATINNCTFNQNSAIGPPNAGGVGGALYSNNGSLTVNSSVFTRNSVSYEGGACFIATTTAKFSNCTFSMNTAILGGAVANDRLNSGSFMQACSFLANNGGEGGAIYEPDRLINCLFVGNSATYDWGPGGKGFGGAIYGVSGMSIFSCTFVANSASDTGGAIYVPPNIFLGLYNPLYWQNTAPIGSDLFQNEVAAPTNQVDPQFFRTPSAGADQTWGTADDDYGDLRLKACSPFVDAGDNSSAPSTDFTGGSHRRDVPTTPDTGKGTGAITDLGAYEAVPALSGTAGGPYRAVEELTTIPLQASAASNIAGTLSLEWDWNGDGIFDDAVGAHPYFSVAGYAVGTVIPIVLRVTDAAANALNFSTTILVVPSVVYVDSNASGAGNGISWNDAFTDLGSALAAVQTGQTIRMADGTYRPTMGTDRNRSFWLIRDVTLFGGYAGAGAATPDARDVNAYPTVLSGNIGAQASASDNSFHVLVGNCTGAAVVLDGFTISDGNAAVSGRGGGIFGYNLGNLVMANCTVVDNSAGINGGAIYNIASPSTFTSCQFLRNFGSNIWNFESNGGAIYADASSPLAFSGCLFSKNSATGGGGAVYSLAGLSLTSCVFNGNSSVRSGGAVSGSVTAYGCAFVGNTVGSSGSNYGGAISGSLADIANCTFVANYVKSGIGNAIRATTLTISNSIIWANYNSIFGANAHQIYSTGTPTVRNSDVQGGWTGIGNIDADPLFMRNPSTGANGQWGTVNDNYGDLRLRVGSPCIDAGDNTKVPASLTTDLGGNPRMVDVPGVYDPGAIVDMGVFERTAPFADIQFDINAVRPTISIRFSVDVLSSSVEVSDLILTNLTTGQQVDCTTATSLSYDPLTRTARWELHPPAADGNYRVALPAASVTDTAGAPALTSDISLDFFLFAADANRDRKVDINDLYILAANWHGSGKVFSQGDFNYDGKVDAIDLGILSSRWQQNLPPPAAPAQPILLSKRAPTRTASRVASLVLA